MKRVNRKLPVHLLTVALVVGLIGCSSSASDDSAKKDGAATLTMITHYSKQQEEELQKSIDQWNKEHPDIRVQHKSTGADFSKLLPTIMAKQTSGQPADIVHVYSLWGGQLAKSNVLAEPPQDVKKDIESSYPSAAVKGSTVNSKLVGYPTEVQTYALYYNKKLLKDAGFSGPPKTWDQLYKIAKATTKEKDGKLAVEGYGIKLVKTPDSSSIVHPFMSFLNAAGGSFINEDGTKATLNSEAGIQTLQFQQKLIQDKVTDTSIETAKSPKKR